MMWVEVNELGDSYSFTLGYQTVSLGYSWSAFQHNLKALECLFFFFFFHQRECIQLAKLEGASFLRTVLGNERIQCLE